MRLLVAGVLLYGTEPEVAFVASGAPRPRQSSSSVRHWQRALARAWSRASVPRTDLCGGRGGRSAPGVRVRGSRTGTGAGAGLTEPLTEMGCCAAAVAAAAIAGIGSAFKNEGPRPPPPKLTYMQAQYMSFQGLAIAVVSAHLQR